MTPHDSALEWTGRLDYNQLLGFKSRGVSAKKTARRDEDIVRRKSVSYILDMNRPIRQPISFSKVSVKSQTVLPRDVRAKLGITPGDTLRYRLTDNGVLIDKAPAEADDPFVAFSEWSSEADEKAYGKL
jgi:bifunctional DNA-binding transcriptional regulator/antitoxin component of YhaV-PrlF toxin-antitoxin module